MDNNEKILNANLKIKALYSDDELTEGMVYDVIDIETFTMEYKQRGGSHIERVYMLRIICDTGLAESFTVDNFHNQEELSRELKLRLLSGHSSISEKVTKLSRSKLLDLISIKVSGD